MGDMQSLWKGTTEFWTQDTIQLFRNNLNRTTDAMSPPCVNTFAKAEHGRRNSLSVLTNTEDAKEKGSRVVLGLPELSNVNSTHHDDSACATALQGAVVEARNPGRQRQDSSEGMSSPSGQALDQWRGKGNHVPTVWSHHQRQGRDHWDQLVDSTATDDRRDTASLQPEGGVRTELDLVQDEIDEAKRLLEEAPLEVRAAQSKVAEAACRV